MHRAVARHPRFPEPSAQLPEVPKLVLLEGGLSESFPTMSILSAALFVCEFWALRRKNRVRRLHALGKAASLIIPEMPPEPAREEITGVHPMLDDAALDRILEDAPQRPEFVKPKPKQKKPREWEVTAEIAGEFARIFLGCKGSLSDFLDQRAERVMNLRLHQRQKFKAFKEVRELEWKALQEHVRTVVMSLIPRSRPTPEGYQVRFQPASENEPALEVVMCSQRKTIISLKQTERPRKRKPPMVRPAPNRRRYSRP